MRVDLISPTFDYQGFLTHAGKACYRSESDVSPEKFLRARIREGHESIIEHASFTFDISGISRACSHQLVRHRLASYSQESQRYVDMSDSIGFVIPPSINNDDQALELFMDTLYNAEDAYNTLRKHGVRKEDARFVLPNATETRIIVTMNFRELRHFFKVRCDKAAQWEIRELAQRMLRMSYLLAPAVFEDLYELYSK